MDDSGISLLASILEEMEELDGAAIRVAHDRSHRDLFQISQRIVDINLRFATAFRAVLAVHALPLPLAPPVPEP
jgi:hypothetical protein